MSTIGKALILFGFLSIMFGVIIWLAGDKLTFIGHLPGDIKIEKENFRFYFPITTMLLFSLILSLFIWILSKIFQ